MKDDPLLRAVEGALVRRFRGGSVLFVCGKRADGWAATAHINCPEGSSWSAKVETSGHRRRREAIRALLRAAEIDEAEVVVVPPAPVDPLRHQVLLFELTEIETRVSFTRP